MARYLIDYDPTGYHSQPTQEKTRKREKKNTHASEIFRYRSVKRNDAWISKARLLFGPVRLSLEFSIETFFRLFSFPFVYLYIYIYIYIQDLYPYVLGRFVYVHIL